MIPVRVAVRRGWALDADEDLVAEHPEEEKPIDAQAEGTEQERLKRGAEEAEGSLAEMDAEAALHEVLEEVGDEVGGNGVDADDDEREGEAAVVFDVDEPGEDGEVEEADAAAPEHPGGGPDAFDDRADAGEVEEQASGHEGSGGEEEAAERDPGFGLDEPAAGDKAEDHGAEGGDEAEGEIAAVVEEEGLGAGELVEEPDVEGLAEVAVHVPVRREAGEQVAVPIGGDADGGPGEVRSGRGIEGPGEPVADEDGAEGGPEPAEPAEGEKEGEGVAETDLGEGVLKGEVGHGAMDGAKEEAEDDEQEAAPDRVAEHAAEGSAALLAAAQRVGKRDADEEGEGRLDGVVEAHADPFDVGLVVAEELPDVAVRVGLRYLRKGHHFAHHEQHD